MEVIDRLRVPRRRNNEPPAIIELLHGDLSELPAEHAVNVLVVSAFPDSYTPDRGTLFEHLSQHGLDMREVAQHKQEDQRDRLGCWISQTLPAELAQRFHFERILCFEPRYPAFVNKMKKELEHWSVEDTVAYVFRCLNNFVIPDPAGTNEERQFDMKRVAMPLLATGNQGVPVETLFPSLLDAAVFWLEEGLPIECLKIVAFDPANAQKASGFFAKKASDFAQKAMQAPPISPPETAWESELARIMTTQVIETSTAYLRGQLLKIAGDEERPVVDALFQRLASVQTASPPQTPAYDLFVSYAHKQDQEVLELVREFQNQVPRREIFYDHQSIPPGGQWLKMISDAVNKARMFVAVLSPDYSASPVCWDEFQCAKLKEYNTRASMIKTVRLRSEPNLPPIMGIYSYIDCAEGDVQKLRASAATLGALL